MILKLIGISIIALSLAACQSTQLANAPSGFRLPPREQIIPDKEPKPAIPANASTDIIALEYAAAYGRANERLEDGAENYTNLANTLAANR